MDKVILKQKATLLEECLEKYSGNNKDIYEVKSGIGELIQLAKNDLVDSPLDRGDVPGVYQWVNSGIGWPVDISDAYYEFRLEISGGLSDVAKEFLASRKRTL
ncbi:hypothetical protein [Psychromonas antarctica]|uniref:hypothetical protein n=1 Tax=Psychromonas antarctica TaxID=67573 RepID=UPI001EE998F3|nr:hypothetical protein [Psychromonas antarctica]MCG6202791.1 hypothetical protein [Psychromonas antarctica]